MPDRPAPQVLPLRTPTFQRTALGAVVLLVLIAFALVIPATGTAQWVVLTIAVLMSVGAVLMVRAMGRRAVVLDGTRIGWTNGITGTGSWTEASAVVLVARNRVGVPVVQPVDNLVLWARAGGMGPVTGLMSRIGLRGEDRARLKEAAAGARLRPFVVPMSDLGPEGAAAVEEWLARR